MNEEQARAVLRLKAIETDRADSHGWDAGDRQWASDIARREVGAKAADADFLATRARHALARLAARGSGLARETRPPWRHALAAPVVLALALAAGLAADSIAPAQCINLLSPPWLAVLGWNLLVYLALALRACMPRPRGADPLRQLDGWRLAGLLHAAALALAGGLLLGLYLRGLVLDYRAGWQSTFLNAQEVHGLLHALLAPASALTGIEVPDVHAIAALRIDPALAPGTGGAPAAGWIHLFAATLLLGVIGPRLLLLLHAAWQARRLAADLPLDLAQPYFEQLAREQADPRAARPATVIPYAVELGPDTLPGLQVALAAAVGVPMRVELLPMVEFGSEDASAFAQTVAAAGHSIFVLFALSATPEAEHHGVLLRNLAAQLAPAAVDGVLLDESAFRARFAAEPRRIEERRAAWRALLAEHGIAPHFADLRDHGRGGQS